MLEFRYQGGNLWLAHLANRHPSLTFAIIREVIDLNDGDITEEFTARLYLQHHSEYDPRNSEWDTMVAGNYQDAVMLAEELLEKYEASLTKRKKKSIRGKQDNDSK